MVNEIVGFRYCGDIELKPFHPREYQLVPDIGGIKHYPYAKYIERYNSKTAHLIAVQKKVTIIPGNGQPKRDGIDESFLVFTDEALPLNEVIDKELKNSGTSYGRYFRPFSPVTLDGRSVNIGEVIDSQGVWRVINTKVKVTEKSKKIKSNVTMIYGDGSSRRKDQNKKIFELYNDTRKIYEQNGMIDGIRNAISKDKAERAENERQQADFENQQRQIAAEQQRLAQEAYNQAVAQQQAQNAQLHQEHVNYHFNQTIYALLRNSGFDHTTEANFNICKMYTDGGKLIEYLLVTQEITKEMIDNQIKAEIDKARPKIIKDATDRKNRTNEEKVNKEIDKLEAKLRKELSPKIGKTCVLAICPDEKSADKLKKYGKDQYAMLIDSETSKPVLADGKLIPLNDSIKIISVETMQSKVNETINDVFPKVQANMLSPERADKIKSDSLPKEKKAPIEVKASSKAQEESLINKFTENKNKFDKQEQDFQDKNAKVKYAESKVKEHYSETTHKLNSPMTLIQIALGYFTPSQNIEQTTGPSTLQSRIDSL
jgi:hypothetical protein